MEPFNLNNFDIQIFRQGDKQLFDRVFDHFYRQIQYALQAMGLQEQDATVVALAVFLKLSQSCHTIESWDHIRNFLYQVARHEFINFKKQIDWNHTLKRRYKNTRLDKDIEQAFFESEFLNLYCAIEALDTKDKQIVDWIIMGYKNQEIADMLGVTPGTFANMKTAIIKKLRHHLLNKDPKD